MRQALHSAWQSFIYGVLKRKPQIDLSLIPDEIHFETHYDEVNKVHWLESPELPGFVVSGKTPRDLAYNVQDTLMVYFDIPTYFAKRFSPIGRLEFTNAKTGEAEVCGSCSGSVGRACFFVMPQLYADNPLVAQI